MFKVRDVRRRELFVNTLEENRRLQYKGQLSLWIMRLWIALLGRSPAPLACFPGTPGLGLGHSGKPLPAQAERYLCTEQSGLAPTEDACCQRGGVDGEDPGKGRVVLAALLSWLRGQV